jgi:hypothetical protein
MAISSIGSNIYSTANGVASPITPDSASDIADPASSADASTVNVAGSTNSSALSSAINQALAQMSGGADLFSLLGDDAQQAGSDFTSSLLASLTPYSQTSSSSDALNGLLGYTNGSAAAAPVSLDQSSPTYQLQSSIQQLIDQLDGNNSTSTLLGIDSTDASSGLGNLQQTFNSLITASGGNPSQASLQSFLKEVAANIQASTSIGTLFDTSA